MDHWLHLCGNQRVTVFAIAGGDNYKAYHGDKLIAALYWIRGSGPIKKRFGWTKCATRHPGGFLWILSVGETKSLTREEFDESAARAIYRINNQADNREAKDKALMQDLLK